MRVAFVSLRTVHHSDTEANRRLDDLATALAARGHDVTVHTAAFWGPDGDDEGETSPDGTHERDGVVYHGVTYDPQDWQGFYLNLLGSIRRVRPEVVHVAATPPGQVRVAKLAARTRRIPVVVEWYGDEGIGGRTRKALSRGDTLVTPSRLVRTRAREHGVGEDHVQVIPNSVDMDLVRDTDPDDRGSIVYARRLDEGANLESVLLALAELRTVGWSATVVGDGPARDDYEQQARDLRIADRIEFVGDCSLEERVGIYRGANVFTQTAHRCVFPTDLMWAMCAGCVGIVEYHADSAAHELVEQRERGFRTTSEDELTQAIEAAADMADLTIDESMEEFHREVVLERYLETYRRLQDEYGLL